MNRYFVAIAALLLPLVANSKVTLHQIFTDNMVLQQNAEVLFKGTASPDKEVTLQTSWNGAVYTVRSAKDGSWSAKVLTPKAGGPYTVTVSDGKPVTLSNVLIGEVWLCGGQSNMEMKIRANVKGMDKTLAESSRYKNVRLLLVANTSSSTPEEDVVIRHGGWQECNAGTIVDFSAVGYYFGTTLSDSLNVPIGLIDSSWGGSLAEAWTSAGALKEIPYFKKEVKKIAALPVSKEERQAIFEKDLAVWAAAIDKEEGKQSTGYGFWTSPSYDASSWTKVSVPGLVREHAQDQTSFYGFFWLRKEVDVPVAWAGHDLTLDLGLVDDNDFTWFNDTLVGHTEGAYSRRTYTIPASAVKAGKAVVSVRVMNIGGLGGIHGDASTVSISCGDDKISLAGKWDYRQSLSLGNTPKMPVNFATESNLPSFMYNTKINPLVHFPIKGAIWYQGEANVDRAEQYKDLLPLMINDWRSKWGYDFPFYIVQLANFMKPQEGPENSSWAELREAQLQTLALENTGMAVIIDIGEADDIHPKNKYDVGYRLALNALAKTYDHDVVYSGPIFKGYELTGSSVKIFFDHAGGLASRDGGELQAFYIAGPDRVFHKAKAKIKGEIVEVSSRKVAFPVSVRYGWANNPPCNLVNAAGLPASPFRTDSWK